VDGRGTFQVQGSAVIDLTRCHEPALHVFTLVWSFAGGVGCPIETGSDAGKVFLSASSSASSWDLRVRVARS
jgi:hypothetical protein